MPVCQLLSPFSFKKRNRAEKKKKWKGRGWKEKNILEIDYFLVPGILTEIYKAKVGVWKAPLLYWIEQMICCPVSSRHICLSFTLSPKIKYIPWLFCPFGPITPQVCFLMEKLCLCCRELVCPSQIELERVFGCWVSFRVLK